MAIELSVTDIMHVIFRHIWKIAVTLVLCVGGAFAYNMLVTPQYAVDAVLLVKTSRSVPVNDASGQMHVPPTEQLQQDIINSYKSILQGRDVVMQAIGKVGLAKVYPDLVENPPANQSLNDAAYDKMEKDLFVETPRDTNLINLKLLNASETVGLGVVHGLIGAFLEKQGRVMSNPQAKFMERQVASAKAQLESSQKALQDFRLSLNTSDIDRDLQQLNDQRLALETRLRDAEQTLRGMLDQRQSLQQSLDKGVPKTVQLYSDNDLRYRSMDDTNGKLTDLQLQESQLLRNYQPDSEPVRRIRNEIALLRRTLGQFSGDRSSRTGINPVYQEILTDATRLDGQIAGARATRDVLAQQLTDVTTKLRTLQEQHSRYTDLQRQYTLADQNYRDYVANMEKAIVADNLNQENITDVSVVEMPQAASRPARPRKAINLAMGAAIGLIGGLIIAILFELADDRVTEAYQISRKGPVPVVATLPTVSAGRRRA